MAVDARVLARGEALTILELLRDGRSLVDKFISKELDEGQQGRIASLIARIAEGGPPKDARKFVHEVDGIHVIKDYQTRIYCFFDDGKRLFLTHGAIKKTNKADPEDLKRARRLRAEYFLSMRKRK